jgi:hypothetical protein
MPNRIVLNQNKACITKLCRQTWEQSMYTIIQWSQIPKVLRLKCYELHLSVNFKFVYTWWWIMWSKTCSVVMIKYTIKCILCWLIMCCVLLSIHNLFFLHCIIFLVCLQAQRYLTWWVPRSSYSVTGLLTTVNLLRYAAENKSSPRVVTGKCLLKN